MAQTYVHGITDTVTHDVTSGLTACQLEAAGPALVIWTITPTAAGRYSPGSPCTWRRTTFSLRATADAGWAAAPGQTRRNPPDPKETSRCRTVPRN
jgi:hypothetical protein